MAAVSQLVLNDLLCFSVNKFGKMPLKTLKTMLIDFYHVDLLSEAKVRLLNDVKDMNLSSGLPHIPLRRTNEAKLLHEADDILSLLTFVDEAKVFDNLPRYVSASPDNMPSCRLYEGDMNVILNFMKDINRRVGEVESSLVTFGQHVTQVKEAVRSVQSVSVPGWPSLQESGCVSQRAVSVTAGNSTLSTTAVIETDRSSACRPKDSSSNMRSEAAPDWATLASTPCVQSNRFSVLSSATDDEGLQNPFTTVVSRRVRNKRRHSQQLNAAAVTDSRQPGVQSGHSGVQSTPAQPGQQRRRALLMHGKSSNSSVIAAAEITRKKFVFCVDNVNTSCTVEKMEEFIRRLSVNVVSCFEVRTRRRYNETGHNLNRKAFRVCIYEDGRNRFLNPDVWPDSVRVSEWFTKRNPGRAGGGDKRIRVGSGGYAAGDVPGDVAATQQPSSVPPPVQPTVELVSLSSSCVDNQLGENPSDDTIIMTTHDNSMEYTDVIDATE